MVSYNFEDINGKYFYVVRVNGLIAGMFTARAEAQEYLRILNQFGMYQAG